MSETQTIQLMGTFALAVVGALTLYAASTRAAWCSYGRWIAGVLGAAQFAFVANRTLFIAGVTSGHTTVLLGGLTGIVVAVIQINLVVLHWDWHRRGLANHQHIIEAA